MKQVSESVANDAGLPDGYLRIGDLAKQFDVTLRTLRFYEDKGLLSPRREGSTRLYSKRDVTKLKLILFGTRIGFSLREIKQVMDLYDPNGSNVKQLRTLLNRSERQLVKLEKQRVAIDEAISELKDAMEDWRRALTTRQTASAAG